MAPAPHPLAGNSGEGPPIAPPHWKWRAGNRISDMYFYSPSGKQFRSRLELANYLQTLNNPPDANLFCWRVTDEVLKNRYIPQDDGVLLKPSKRKARSPAGGGKKRMKTLTVKPLLRPAVSFVKADDLAGQPTQLEPVTLLAPCRGPSLSLKGTTCFSLGLHSSNRRARKIAKRVKISVPHSFKSILAGRSSFKWLYDSDTLEKFLEEAQRLKNKSAADTNEIRNVLLDRHLDTSNICKYPNSVIRVFVRLLRNEEAPSSLGKIELAHLCVNWKCKKRHHWCLLEVGRMNFPRKFTKVDDLRGGRGFLRSKVSVSHSVVVQMNRDNQNTVDGKATGYADLWFTQPGAKPSLDFQLPNGSSEVAGDWTNSPAPVQFQPQECSTSSPSQDLDNVIGTGANAEGSSFEERAGASNLKLGNGDTDALNTENSVKAVVSILHREDLPGSEASLSRPVKRATAVDHGNDTTFSQPVKDRTQRMSEQFAPNVMRKDPSWDRANISKATDDLLLGAGQAASDELVLSLDRAGDYPAKADILRKIEAVELVPQNGTQSVLSLGPFPDLYGESIIVVTGFKSSTSKGAGMVCQGDEAAQLKGGTFAIDNDRWTSALERPSKSYNECKLSEMYLRASTDVNDALDDILQRKGKRDSGSSPTAGDLTSGFPGIMKSEIIERELRGNELVWSQEPASALNHAGEKTLCLEPESSWNSVQGSLHREELQWSGSVARSRDDRGDTIQGYLSKPHWSSDVIELRMVPDLQVPTSPVTADGGAFSSNDPTPQLVIAAVRQESLVSHDEDVSPTVIGAHRIAHVSEPVVESDKWTEEELFNENRKENLPLTPKQTVASDGTFACCCKICSSDFSFCRGCMCSFCREILQPGEDWKVLKCICSHVCHMDCALAAKASGVAEDLGLDAELSCTSCFRKVDLWVFFQKRFDLILSISQVANVNLKCLENLLLQALQLLKGTEKTNYKSIEGLVIESYELVRKAPIFALIQDLLRAVCDDLYLPHSGDADAETLVGGLVASPRAEEIYRLKNNYLARKSSDNAKNERTVLDRVVVDKVHRANEDALNKRTLVRSAPRALKIGEPQLLKHNVNPCVPEDLIISQQAKVDKELNKLWDMRKCEVWDFTTISVLDASAAEWMDCLKLQRVVVEAAQAKLQHLKKLSSQTKT